MKHVAVLCDSTASVLLVDVGSVCGWLCFVYKCVLSVAIRLQ